MSNETDKLSAKAKQLGGKLTDNKEMEVKGKLQELKAKAKDVIDDVKDAVEKKTDSTK